MIDFNQLEDYFKTHVFSTFKHTSALVGEVPPPTPMVVLAKEVKYSSWKKI